MSTVTSEQYIATPYDRRCRKWSGDRCVRESQTYCPSKLAVMPPCICNSIQYIPGICNSIQYTCVRIHHMACVCSLCTWYTAVLVHMLVYEVSVLLYVLLPPNAGGVHLNILIFDNLHISYF